MILKNPQVRSELSLSALGLFFQEQEEGDAISSAILWYEVLHPTFTIYGQVLLRYIYPYMGVEEVVKRKD